MVQVLRDILKLNLTLEILKYVLGHIGNTQEFRFHLFLFQYSFNLK